MSQNPELDQLYADLRAAVEKQVQEFWNKYKLKIGQELQKSMGQPSQPIVDPRFSQSTQGNKPALASGLPWFQHGMRGFLRKLWYGDHPDNPNWKGVRTESFSLNEYKNTRDELRELVVEAIGDSEADALVAALMPTIVGYLGKAVDVSKKSGSEFHPMIKYNPRGVPVEDTPSEELPSEKVKKPRGRPKKIRIDQPADASVEVPPTIEPSTEKKPRKKKSDSPTEVPSVEALPGQEGLPQENPLTAAKTAKKAEDPIELKDEDYKELAGKYVKAYMRSAEENPSSDGIYISDEMKDILRQAGAQFVDGELKNNSITAKALIELTYQMSREDGGDYWRDPEHYVDFYKLKSDKKVRDVLKILAPQKLNAQASEYNPDEDNQFDNRESRLLMFKKMLRENKKEDKVIFESKKIPFHLKKEFFKQALVSR